MLGNKRFVELIRTHCPRKYKKIPVNTGRHDIFPIFAGEQERDRRLILLSVVSGTFLERTALELVSFAAVIRVVTQCSSPTNGCSLELYIPFLKLTNKDQASISWKPGPLAANVTRNMIGAAANSYMHVVGSP